MEVGQDKEAKNLYNSTEDIAKNVIDKLGNIPEERNYSRNNNIQGNSTIFSNNAAQEIDYNKMYLAFLKALNSCKMRVDEDGFVKIIDDRIVEVL